MADWKTRFDLRDVWSKRNGEVGSEDWTDKTVHELAKEIARRIRRKWPQNMLDGEEVDYNLTEIYDRFLSIPTMPEHECIVALYFSYSDMHEEDYQKALQNPPIKEFNIVMDLFYDWCGQEMVWIDK